MSEENKDLGDEIKDTASDLADGAKEVASDVADGAKEVAGDVKEEWDKIQGSKENKKMMAGLLGILLGGFGAHKFILGYNTEGLILLGIFLISIPLMCIVVGSFTIMIPGIIGLIEGIIYLTKSDEEFYETYQANKKAWF